MGIRCRLRISKSGSINLSPSPLLEERDLAIDYQSNTPLLPEEKGLGDEVDYPWMKVQGKANEIFPNFAIDL